MSRKIRWHKFVHTDSHGIISVGQANNKQEAYANMRAEAPQIIEKEDVKYTVEWDD